jgi:hypothetical protein
VSASLRRGNANVEEPWHRSHSRRMATTWRLSVTPARSRCLAHSLPFKSLIGVLGRPGGTDVLAHHGALVPRCNR